MQLKSRSVSRHHPVQNYHQLTLRSKLKRSACSITSARTRSHLDASVISA